MLFDKNDSNISTLLSSSPSYSKLTGILLKKKQKNKNDITHDIFKVTSIEKIPAKLKVTSFTNNYGRVKCMIYSPMVGKKEAEREGLNINYIRNVAIKSDDKLIYSVNLSPHITKDPFLKFSYKNIKPLSLTVEYTDNNGSVGRHHKAVKHRDGVMKIAKEVTLLRNPKTYPNKIKNIKKLFGDITLIEDGIKLIAPRLAENGASIPITVKSDIKFKSIVLFMKSNNSNFCESYDIKPKKNNEFKLVSQWFATPYSIVNFSLRIKMGETGEVLIVLEAENGKFYTIKKEIDVSIGGGGMWD